MFCRECGKEIADAAVICVQCGVPTGKSLSLQGTSKSRWIFVLAGLFLGGLGVHNFYAGYFVRGAVQLAIVLLVGWLIVPLIIVGIWILIELFTVRQDAHGNPFV